MDPAVLLASFMPTIIDIGTKVVGAILLFVVGRFLIGMALRLLEKSLAKAEVDATLRVYAHSSGNVVLNLMLILGMLSVFGVETTSFAGILAAAGLAIGMAWSGLLANFAAGVFMVVLRPFQVGDMVEVGGIVGTIREIGLFATILDTPDNVRTILGNNAVFSGTIRVFTANPFRRVDLQAQLAHGVDPADATKRLLTRLKAIENVMETPAPDVEILTFNERGPVLAVRPYCHNDHYWQVYFDTNRTIRETFGEAAYPVPESHVRMHTVA